MRPIFFIGAIVAAVAIAALTAGTSNAHGESELKQSDDERYSPYDATVSDSPIADVNDAPLAAAIPAIELTTRQGSKTLDLGEFFTDPDGDTLAYTLSAEVSPSVTLVTLEGDTLSIAPMGAGTVSFDVVAADTGGLRATGTVDVSVTHPMPASTHVAAKVPLPFPSETPPPSGDAHSLAAVTEPYPAHAPLWRPSERRYRNMTQQPDSVSKVIAAFAVEPVDTPAPKLIHPPPPPMVTYAPTPARSDVEYVPWPWMDTDVVPAPQGQAALQVEADDDGGLPWLTILLALIAVPIVGHLIYILVMHRVSQPLRTELSGLRHRLLRSQQQ